MQFGGDMERVDESTRIDSGNSILSIVSSRVEPEFESSNSPRLEIFQLDPYYPSNMHIVCDLIGCVIEILSFYSFYLKKK